MKLKKILLRLYIFAVAFKSYFINSFLMSFPWHGLRLFFLKRSLGALGSGNFIRMYVEVRNGRRVFIGKNNSINQHVLLDGRGGDLTIGNNVDIAQETNIWTLEHNVHDDFHAAIGGDVVIEDYVWIASRVTILPGVIVGRGAVVASNSVVTKNVDPMTIVGGVPAKKIGLRKSGLKYNPSQRHPFR
jgi:acetyltransferase-like isoleucine patch superfamily enzyme